MHKYSGFSDEQHKSSGVMLNIVFMISANFYLDVCQNYGKASRLAKLAETQRETVEKLRSLLANENFEAYYPHWRNFQDHEVVPASELPPGLAKYAMTAEKAQ